MDLSNYNVKQLKEIIRNYNLHYHIKDYYKKSRPELEGIIHDYMEYVNDKIYNKKQVEVSKPKEVVKKVRIQRTKKVKRVNVPKENTNKISKEIIDFDKLTDKEKDDFAEKLSDKQYEDDEDKLQLYEYIQKYASMKFNELLNILSLGIKNPDMSFKNESYYIDSMMPYLQDLPEVKESNNARGYVKKMKILEPLKNRLEENFKQVIKPLKKWLKIKTNLQNVILKNKYK